MIAAASPYLFSCITARTRPAAEGSTRAMSFPSFATWRGSNPSISQATKTSSRTGIASSSITILTCDCVASSLSVLANPPLVGSRRARIFESAAIITATIRLSGAQSLASRVEKLSPSRLLITAIPWSPIGPDRRTASPGCAFLPERSIPSGTIPIPAVLIYSLSTFPRSTTLVSPVTMLTPASAAVRLIDVMILSRSAIASPSSMMREREMYSGRAPDIARSFTVPQTASLPMSPPGKKIGSTT